MTEQSIWRRSEAKLFGWLRRKPPQTRLARLGFWLFVVYLAFLSLTLLPGNAGDATSTPRTLVLIALIIVCIPLMWRFATTKMLWKLRNRLVVTYLLIGLAPFALLATLVGITEYLFAGQFAIFAATSELNAELSHMSNENHALAVHVAHILDMSKGSAKSVRLPELEERYTKFDSIDRKVAIFNRKSRLFIEQDPDAKLKFEDARVETVPEWVGGRFLGLVLDGDSVHLRVADREEVNGIQGVSIASEPVTQAMLMRMASGLGTATILPTLALNEEEVGEAPGQKAESKPKATVTFGRPKGDLVQVRKDGTEINENDLSRTAITGGTLPPPAAFYDIPIVFGTQISVVDWKTGKKLSIPLSVSSRPTLLYARLFSSSLVTGNIIRIGIISLAVVFALIEAFALFMASRLSRTITGSVSDLYQATQQIDHGNFEHRIEVKSQDQLAELSKSFNRMSESLERLLEEQKEAQKLQNELSIAYEVQANLFPSGDISLPTLELHGVCRPARSVSGDYYDFLLLGDTELGLAIGDISGKGISAALLMATLHSAVRAYRFAGEELVYAEAGMQASHGGALIGRSVAMMKANGNGNGGNGELFQSPGRILSLLNRHLYRSTQPEKYATLFLSHYNGLTGRLTYSNGGQLPPLVVGADHVVRRLDQGGTVVGLIDGMEYEEGSVQMRSGDIFIGYSDGVTEPENEFGDFGEDRLVEIVQRYRTQPLPVISAQVMQALTDWIGGQEQPDDITLVLARQR